MQTWFRLPALQARRQRRLGIIPVTRFQIGDEDLIDALADRVANTLRHAIDGQPTDERLLALGLLGAAAQFPIVLSRDDAARHARTLTALIKHADPPVKGMSEAIETVYAAMTRKQQEAASHAT